MWQLTARVIRGLLYYGFPTTTAAVGIYATYRSTQVDGASSVRAFVVGVVLILGTWAWTAARSQRTQHALAVKVRDLELRIEGIVRALDAHDATSEVLDALRPAAPDIPRRRDCEDDAQVIPLDPHS